MWYKFLFINIDQQEVRATIRRREEEIRASTESSSISGQSSRQANTVDGQLPLGHQGPQGIVGSTLANVLVIVGFAAFAYTVKYVLKSIAHTQE